MRPQAVEKIMDYSKPSSEKHHLTNHGDFTTELAKVASVKPRSILYHLRSMYLFTYSDFKVIVWPQTAAGVFQALAGGLLTSNAHPSVPAILGRLPLVVFWNWYNVLAFNVANQRLPDSVLEDRSNKPWRPLPSGRIDPEQARRLLFFLIPIGSFLSYNIGGFKQAMALVVLTWMYNDLGGGHDHYLTRNIINGLGFICHASGSTLVAAGPASTTSLTSDAVIWHAMIGALVFSTVQVQDLPDMEGDGARGRKTFPLVHGHMLTRFSIAGFVLLWSVVCPAFWAFDSSVGYLALILPGALIAYRTLALRSVEADEKTYKIWCVWLMLVYLQPLLRNPQSVLDFAETLSA